MIAERAFLLGIFDSTFRGSPTEPVWEWADANVRFSEKMAAEVTGYDSRLTPWTRAWQDLPRDPDTREGAAMKSSQSGYTEATLNVIRWMPKHWPGNVGYVINSLTKARRISKVRLAETLKDCAADQVSEDPNDFSTFHIVLRNMEIAVAGSGSPNPFRETWYRLGVLDEPEDHENLPDGTTYSAMQSRFTTVSDALLFVLGKPQHEGGIIHRAYVKGSQEKWMVPCPHCGERIELRWEFLRFGHCKDLAEGWDLDRVEAETFYECQKCHEPIRESQKKAMVAKGEWVPTALKERMKLDGRSVAPEPGVRSFHISDLYSSFPGVRWGALAKKWLTAHVLAPNHAAQDDFRTNHLGLPIEAREMGLKDTAILNLRGGLVEERDGKRIVLGERFGLVYERGEQVGMLPFKPKVLTITGDRQKEIIKYLVFAWNERGESFLVDFGMCADEDEFLSLRTRPYPWVGNPRKPFYTFGGLIDSRYRQKRVYEACLKGQALGWSVHPSRGSGFHSEFRGRNLREVEDWTDSGQQVMVIEYYDHGVKCDFYLGKIARREEPRLWLPDPVPDGILTEWTSEKFVVEQVGGRKIQRWVHDDTLGPNDWGDCGKKQFVFWQMIGPTVMAESVKRKGRRRK